MTTNGSEWGTLEARFRAALAELRPMAGAPATLRGRIDVLPDVLGEQGLALRLLRSVASPLAVTAILGVISLGALVLFGRPVTGPATTGGVNPTPAIFDPTVVGPGLLHAPIPTLPIAAGLVVVLGLALARRWNWRSIVAFETFRDMGRGLVLIAMVAGPSWLALHGTLAYLGGSEGAASGYGLPVHPPLGLDGPDVYYETAAPGGPIIAFFDVTNVSPLPVTFEGLVDEGFVSLITTTGEEHTPSWTSLALASVPNVFPNTGEQLRPFTPTTLPPNAQVTVYLVGRAGACAFGPGFDAQASVNGGFVSMSREIKLGYSVLGLSSTTTVEMPMQLVEPAAEHCP